MSNKLHNRVLLPNGQFGSFPEKKLDDEGEILQAVYEYKTQV